MHSSMLGDHWYTAPPKQNVPVCPCRILRPWQNSEPRSITNTTLCTKCGGAGHISSDCKYTRSADQFTKCKYNLVMQCLNLFVTMFAVWLCAAHSLPTERRVASLLSQLRTRRVWTRSICPLWLSWGRLRSPHLVVDTPATREELRGPQDPTTTSRHRLVGNT